MDSKNSVFPTLLVSTGLAAYALTIGYFVVHDNPTQVNLPSIGNQSSTCNSCENVRIIDLDSQEVNDNQNDVNDQEEEEVNDNQNGVNNQEDDDENVNDTCGFCKWLFGKGNNK